MQIDSLMELPAKKRPSSSLIWDGTQEELTEWLETVFDTKSKDKPGTLEFVIPENEIEG